jgi:hypothetical protein
MAAKKVVRKVRSWYVVKTDLTSGRIKIFNIDASTARGASMIVNRDHYTHHLCFNRVYDKNPSMGGKLVFSSN